MKILVVDVDFEYKNPMYRQFYQNLSYCMDVDYFGPGYVGRDELERGIVNYTDNNGDYDAIIVGIYFIYSANQGMRYDAYMVHRHVIPYYFVNDAYQCCKNILEELNKLDNVIKICFYYEDFCTMPQKDYQYIRTLINKGYYLMSWPREYMEEIPGKIRAKYPILTQYAMELANIRERYIPISIHAISYHEIFVQTYGLREFEWCIPGNKRADIYPERKKASLVIAEAGRNTWNYDPFQKLSVDTIAKGHINWYEFRNNFEKVATLMIGKDKYISTFPKTIHIAACRENYLDSMRKSKKVFSEGGIGNCFVRKYFESCACGALSVVKEIPGLKQMGFVDELNCIIVKDYRELKSQRERFEDDVRNAQIAKEGQRLILSKHMYHHRAEALQKTIKAIQRGIYRGAVWVEGSYVIQGND